MQSNNLNKIDIVSFLRLAGEIPVADVRSPGEFLSGHIPGAVNIPLFDDDERRAVGTAYKKEGRDQAVLLGAGFAGKNMQNKLKKALETAVNGELLVHCWRGGMRSEAMAWLFSTGGLKCHVLEGGYKAYRNYILSELSVKKKMLILGGLTGSSKTHIIRLLKDKGEQVIDLERLASHKGSAFGSLGESPQPGSEHFANLLFQEWSCIDNNRPVWLEDESRNIGSVFIPDAFFANMMNSPAIVLLISPVHRMPRLIEEYSGFNPDLLKASVEKIRKRMGNESAGEAIKAIDSGNIRKAIEIVLEYYDKTYRYSLSRKKNAQIIYVESDTDDIGINTKKVLEASLKVTL
jgi:tRNA 2-selenouridine synthase